LHVSQNGWHITMPNPGRRARIGVAARAARRAGQAMPYARPPRISRNVSPRCRRAGQSMRLNGAASQRGESLRRLRCLATWLA
jgi:hypothetical protein